MTRHRGSLDANHNAVADAFTALGCSVTNLALSGVPNFPDLLVGCIGQNYLVEIKNPATAYGRKGLNEGQSAFARDWRGGPVYVVSDPGDVPFMVKHWRARCRAIR